MRILFQNILKDSTFSATNGSSNYPALNLVHPFLQKRFQSIAVSSVVTFPFSEDQSANCFFYGYLTCTGLTIVLKDSGDSVLDTIVVSSPDDIGVSYFPLQTTIRSIELTITGPDPFYLGGVAAGVFYQMPDPLAVYSDSPEDNSFVSESPYGQTLQNYVKPLRAYEFGFRNSEQDIKKEIKEKYIAAGIGRNLYFDFFEENRDKEPPMYGKIVNPVSFSYNPRRYDYVLAVKESR